MLETEQMSGSRRHILHLIDKGDDPDPEWWEAEMHAHAGERVAPPQVLTGADLTSVFHVVPQNLLLVFNSLAQANAGVQQVHSKLVAPRFRAIINGESVPFLSVEEKFQALAESWEDHNFGRSVIDFNHLAHYQIIGMGPPVVRLLMERVAQGEGKWIYALKCITGEQAETPEMHGNAKRVIEAWIEWGRQNGHIR